MVARTLRVFRIFRVLRMLRVVTLGPGSSLQRQIAMLVVSVLSMVFCAAGIYQVIFTPRVVRACLGAHCAHLHAIVWLLMTLQITESTSGSIVPFHRAVLYMTIIVIGRPPVPTLQDASVIMVRLELARTVAARAFRVLAFCPLSILAP
jgi:hypothetical protein